MKKAFKIFLLVLIILTVISTASYCSAPYDTEPAHIISVRKTIDGGGYVLRNESVADTPKTGLFEPSVKDGDRVAKGSLLGVFTGGEIDEKLANELADVTRRINEIKNSEGIASLYASDEARIYSVMKSTTAAIRKDCQDKNYLSAAENTRQLGMLVEKKYSVENATAQDKLLIDLEQEKLSLEGRLGGIRENVIAPASGYFRSTLDGLEGIYKEEELSLLTTEGIKSYETALSGYKGGASAGKVADSYVWYLAATVPKEDSLLLDTGKSVTVSIDGSAFVKASVIAVNPDENGSVAIVLKSTRNIPGIYEKRTVQFEICTRESTGLYVPAAAIRVVDDVTGVYVMGVNNTVSFKCVNILLEEDDYYIVSKDFTPPEDCKYPALNNYDNVLVNPEVSRLDKKLEKES